MRTLLLAALIGVGAQATAASAQFTDNKIKIGVLTDMASVYSDVAGRGSVESAKMAIESLGGKIKGIPVELISADHQNKVDIGSSIARKWFDEEGVDVIIDVPNSAIALAVNEIARERGKALLVSGAGTSDLTATKCSPTLIHWSWDTSALANGIAKSVIKSGGKKWFFVTADYAFGHALQRDVSALVVANGGEVIGSVRHPLNNADFSSYLIQAQSSGAQVIGLANAGNDFANTLKQATEFGITKKNQTLAALLVNITDIHAAGLKAAEGLLFTTSFYWNRTPETRSFAQRLAARNAGVYPDSIQAGVYASLLHYAKAVEQTGTDDGRKVVSAMKAIPTSDALFGEGRVREDGRKIHPFYLFKAKSPEASKEPWDYYELVDTIPGEEVFRAPPGGLCRTAQ